jgi:hypothetical protein
MISSVVLWVQRLRWGRTGHYLQVGLCHTAAAFTTLHCVTGAGPG